MKPRLFTTPSMTWPESVGQALCYGWIDGERRPTSIWSAVNIMRVTELDALGRMQSAGTAAFARRSDRKSAIYSYEQDGSAEFAASHLNALKANTRAWVFFQAQAPWYRRRAIYRVGSAKQEATSRRRLEAMIKAWAQQRVELL